MQLKVGPHTYTVRRVWRLDDGAGVKCNGLSIFGTRVIWLTGELKGEALIETLRHEYGHLWDHHTATPRTTEERQQWFATVAEAFDQQFTAAGGQKALKKVRIEGEASLEAEPGEPPIKTPAPLSYRAMNDRMECAFCAASVMVGSIVTSPPRATTRGCWWSTAAWSALSVIE